MLQRLVFGLALALGLAGAFASDAEARVATIRFTHPGVTGVTSFRIYLRQTGQSYGAPAWQGLPTASGGIYTVNVTAPDVSVYAVGTAINASGESVLSNEILLAGSAPVCGNTFLEPPEQCDDGDTSPGDGCRANCTIERCGDAIRDASEQCDDGNTAGGDGCSSTCRTERVPACGDAILDTGEQCDDGNTSAGDGCRANCTIERCGDAIRDASEQCDDGNTAGGDGCSSTCRTERVPACGDAILDTGEQCDDGNTSAGDGCRADCTRERCGDARLDPAEQCDDGNTTSGDGCRANCSREVCGDGQRDAGEQCDDGNSAVGDGCRANCTIEDCGDRLLDPGEQCDDGNASAGDGCRSDCTAEVCGDDRLDPGEQCDDGNPVSGDGCDGDCLAEEPIVCGDGHLDEGEQCDDGNTTNGDGCSSTCGSEVTSSPMPLRVNVGGPDYTDPGLVVWLSDDAFTSDGTSQTTSEDVRATSSDPLYRSRRFGEVGGPPVTFEFPVEPEVLYFVRLHFAELDGVKRGERVFDVVIEDAVLLDDLDLAAQSGTGRATTRDRGVFVADDVLTVRLVPQVGRPMLSGLEIHRADSSEGIPLIPPKSPKIVGCGKHCR